ncbi:uncharacterized protein CCOS01_16381 [Colletotrichum costaricense]|uniref:Uncharacterized protein n=1 Tax=Colletotrichum costaricense TaxID=1209916 RepID=A0AAI9YFZ4_9PEZI|nr:uncharacterized protein CCOS01_16381 [Colletotrichum costaricense]KAK1507122.1 hypothetical protein CCOS01_16381 [Colletotrichum costaricense]
MTGALLESQPRIEELGRRERCSSASTSTSASISTRSPPLYYGTTPLVAGTDDRRMNPQQLPKDKTSETDAQKPTTPSTGGAGKEGRASRGLVYAQIHVPSHVPTA